MPFDGFIEDHTTEKKKPLTLLELLKDVDFSVLEQRLFAANTLKMTKAEQELLKFPVKTNPCMDVPLYDDGYAIVEWKTTKKDWDIDWSFAEKVDYYQYLYSGKMTAPRPKKVVGDLPIDRPTLEAIIDILTRARALVAEGWMQGTFGGYDPDTETVRYCALGAIHKAHHGRPGRPYDSNPNVTILDYAYKALSNVVGNIPSWNDYGGRTQAQVVAGFDESIGRLQRMLP